MGGKLDGVSAIITGAASGIGQAIAFEFLRAGAQVLALDKNEEGLRSLTKATASSGQLEIRALDVTASDAPAAAVAICQSRFGRVDVLVNCAGKGGTGAAHETSDEQFDLTVGLNLRSLFRLSREVLPSMMVRKRGCILNIASVAGLIGDEFNSPYSAAKAGVVGLTRQMACEYGRYNIRVNAIAPAITATPATAERLRHNPRFRATQVGGVPLMRAARPEEIAKPAVFLCSDDASFITGQTLAVDGGYTTTKFRSYEEPAVEDWY